MTSNIRLRKSNSRPVYSKSKQNWMNAKHMIKVLITLRHIMMDKFFYGIDLEPHSREIEVI